METIPSKQAVFLLGINLFVSSVVGASIAWSSIDLALGSLLQVLHIAYVFVAGQHERQPGVVWPEGRLYLVCENFT